MQERQRSWYVARAWSFCRVQASSHVPSAALEWAATASSENGLQALAAQEMQWTLALSTDVHGVRELHASSTANQKGNSVGPNKLEMVASFCYLGDMLSAAGGCELSTTTRVKTAWKKFKELLSVPSPRSLSFRTCGSLYSSYVRSAMLHASETWRLTKQNLQRLQRNGRAMIRQSAMSSCKMLSPSCPMSYLRGFALRIWTSFWRRDGSAGMDM